MLDLLVATRIKSKPRVNECDKIDQEARLGGRVARVFFPHCMRRFSPCFQRAGCSTPDPPHLSVSTRSFSLLTHVGSPGIYTLHSAEATFSTTEPYRCHIVFQKAVGNLIHDYWGVIPFSTTTPAHHDQRQCTQARPAPNTYQVPVSATRYQAPVPSYKPLGGGLV